MISHEIETMIEEASKSDKPLVLSKESEAILKKALGIENLDQAIDLPFKGDSDTLP